ncbi:hypothetical protein [Vibrio bivalvicida]|uniref:RiboL-PSP-HEPN domain-containing protein n=1 Tax=Vibrio bivalvicida TaxID=1276888 RepID=A0A177XXM8_9VIBR|nr:hypothetical protein [Vibrio bivalvicida]OAJ93106.1 hypothetical protein APB76_16530 [Vibrio bivalvicida]
MNKISVKIQARSACDCFKIANTSLELARRAEEDWEREHHCITGITFTAFSIEAMLNHFGKIYDKNWNELKMERKSLHKRLFEFVNLPNYLGSKNYQLAKQCFEMRDAFAHGKTVMESVEVELPELTDDEALAMHMCAISSAPFRNSTFQIFESFVKVAREIEHDIQKNGFYPDTMDHPLYAPQPLRECPLSVIGMRVW